MAGGPHQNPSPVRVRPSWANLGRFSGRHSGRGRASRCLRRFRCRSVRRSRSRSRARPGRIAPGSRAPAAWTYGTVTREPLTTDEANRLREAATTLRERLIVWILLDTGLRVREFCELDAGALDWHHGTLRVRGKGAKVRVVPLPPRTRDLLERTFTLEPSELRRMRPRTVQRVLRRLGRAAGIARPVTPHVLRHTFAVHCLQRGLSLASLQRLLGHNHLATTARYLNISNAEAIREFQRLGEGA